MEMLIWAGLLFSSDLLVWWETEVFSLRMFYVVEHVKDIKLAALDTD